MFLAIVEKIFAGRFLVIELTRKLTNTGSGDVAEVFQKVSIVHAIALSKFLAIQNQKIEVVYFLVQ